MRRRELSFHHHYSHLPRGLYAVVGQPNPRPCGRGYSLTALRAWRFVTVFLAGTTTATQLKVSVDVSRLLVDVLRVPEVAFQEMISFCNRMRPLGLCKTVCSIPESAKRQ